jgi:hypothetical protein
MSDNPMPMPGLLERRGVHDKECPRYLRGLWHTRPDDCTCWVKACVDRWSQVEIQIGWVEARLPKVLETVRKQARCIRMRPMDPTAQKDAEWLDMLSRVLSWITKDVEHAEPGG